jgi:hypothetical protein
MMRLSEIAVSQTRKMIMQTTQNKLETPVVPKNINRVKRIAKELHEIYPLKSLSTCQAVTANLFGYKDWHAIEEAVKGPKKPGPFDEELDPYALVYRHKKQQDILIEKLGKIDPNQDYPVPEKNKKMFSANNGTIKPEDSDRMNKMLTRYNIHLAKEFTLEKGITNQNPIKKEKFENKKNYDPSTIHQELGIWCANIMPDQPEISEKLKNYHFDSNSPLSILQFGHYWGMLCNTYPGKIYSQMAKGTAYLLADHYAFIKTNRLPEVKAFINKMEFLDDDEIQFKISEINNLEYSFMVYYLGCYPKDNFYALFTENNAQFLKDALHCTRLLKSYQKWTSSPTSTMKPLPLKRKGRGFHKTKAVSFLALSQIR